MLFMVLQYLNIELPMPGLEIGGEMNMTAGIQVAQLALKHRQNKKQQQRIIVFAGRCNSISHSCPLAFLSLIRSETLSLSLRLTKLYYYLVSVQSNTTKRCWRQLEEN